MNDNFNYNSKITTTVLSSILIANGNNNNNGKNNINNNNSKINNNNINNNNNNNNTNNNKNNGNNINNNKINNKLNNKLNNNITKNQKYFNLIKVLTYWCYIFLICDNSHGEILVNGFENNHLQKNFNSQNHHNNENEYNNYNNNQIILTTTTTTTIIEEEEEPLQLTTTTIIKTPSESYKNNIIEFIGPTIPTSIDHRSVKNTRTTSTTTRTTKSTNYIKLYETTLNNKNIYDNNNKNNNNKLKINKLKYSKNKYKNKYKNNNILYNYNYKYNKNRYKRHSGDFQQLINNRNNNYNLNTNNYNNKNNNKDLNAKMLQRPDFYDIDDDDQFDDDDSYEMLLRNKSAYGMYIGARCNGTCHSDLAYVTCDPSTFICGCDKNHPVIIGPAKGCTKSKRLGQQCHFHESCLFNDENSLCIQIKHNAMCQCKDGYHMVSYNKPVKKNFCTRDLVLVNSDMPTLLGVVAGIFVLAGLICMVLHLFSKTKYPRRPFADTNPSPTILYNSNDTGIPLTVRSGRPSSRSSFHSSDSLGSYGNRRPSSALQSGSKGILVSTSRTGSRRASLTSIHSVPSIRSYSASRFEKELQQKEIRQEMKIRLGQLTQENKSKDSLHPPSEGF